VVWVEPEDFKICDYAKPPKPSFIAQPKTKYVVGIFFQFDQSKLCLVANRICRHVVMHEFRLNVSNPGVVFPLSRCAARPRAQAIACIVNPCHFHLKNRTRVRADRNCLVAYDTDVDASFPFVQALNQSRGLFSGFCHSFYVTRDSRFTPAGPVQGRSNIQKSSLN
jgi:hypothetical protein